MRRLTSSLAGASGWLVLQPGRYRYMADVDSGAVVRIVMSEYLACEVVWS